MSRPKKKAKTGWISRLGDVQTRVRRGEYAGFVMSHDKPGRSILKRDKRETDVWLAVLDSVRKVLTAREHVVLSDHASVREWIFAFGGSALVKRGRLEVSDPTDDIARWIDAGWCSAVPAAAAREDFKTPEAAHAALVRRGLTEKKVCAPNFPGWTPRTRRMFRGERAAQRRFLEMVRAVAALIRARGLPSTHREAWWWTYQFNGTAFYARGELWVRDPCKEITRWLAFGWTDAKQATLAQFEFKTPQRARAALVRRKLTEGRVCEKDFPGWTRETRLHFEHEREVEEEIARLKRSRRSSSKPRRSLPG